MSDPAKELRILEAMRDMVGDYCPHVQRSVVRQITPYDDLGELPAVGFYPGETEPAEEQTGLFTLRFIVMAEVVVAVPEDEILPLLYQIGKDVTRMMLVERDKTDPFGIEGMQDVALWGASDLASDAGGDVPTGARVFRFMVSYRTTQAELLAE